MEPKYPNLELIDFKAKMYLANDDSWQEKFKKIKKENKYAYVNFDAMVFSQIWGSTCTGFDVCKDGSPAIGGCAMTKEYTTVMHETSTDTYVIFFGEKACYSVEDKNDKFIEDLRRLQLAGLKEAMKIY